MKRRDFLKLSSLTLPAAMTGERVFSETKGSFHFPNPQHLSDVITQNGEILVRLKFSSADAKWPVLVAGDIMVKNAMLAAITRHNFEANDDLFDSTNYSFRLQAHKRNADILVLHLKDADDQTTVIVHLNQQVISFALADLLKTGYLQFEHASVRLDVNFLLDFEIGEIDLAQIGVRENPDDFCFHIFADPQGGDPQCRINHRTRMKIHNAFIEDSIVLANHLPERPLFSLILGDIVDSQGEEENFGAMQHFWQQLDSPILYELGNHESRYASTFEPGYNMDALHNFFDAQKKLNGLEKILYSFNVGKWHFVVWPDPLRSFFWDNHPHYFEWLQADLEKYKNRPTMVFQHVPVHPIGISPFPAYLEPASIRRTFVDIVTRYGNVHYVLSGHIHIPVKSSLKTACSIHGSNFITLPAAGYRPRGFGEQDYFGGPSQGVAIVNITGERARVTFKTVMEEELTYPEKCPELNLDRYKLWFNNKWEVTAEPNIVNGDFRNGLDGWVPEYIYEEDDSPSVICQARQVDDRPALYLYNRIRGYQAPGQDRLPQTINRMCQAVQVKPGHVPALQFQYKLDRKNCDLLGYCGGYVWIEGYDNSCRQFNLVYSAGTAFANPIDRGIEKIHDVFHFHLPDTFDWATVQVNIQKDFESMEPDQKIADLNVNRLVFTLGVWTLNEGTDQPFAICFTDFKLTKNPSTSTANGDAIQIKTPEKIWWQGKHMPFIHLAGEHRYHLQTTDKTLFEREFERFG
ncbi:metallophosphoesterase [candidate division KSB1 bacterium]|nr:metallophosphoesterase [candidate division KSB1 bacterium]